MPRQAGIKAIKDALANALPRPYLKYLGGKLPCQPFVPPPDTNIPPRVLGPRKSVWGLLLTHRGDVLEHFPYSINISMDLCIGITSPPISASRIVPS